MRRRFTGADRRRRRSTPGDGGETPTTISFGALTSVDEGGAPLTAPNGDYGPYQVFDNVVTPRVSLASVTTEQVINGTTIAVPVADTRTVSTSAELQATYPGTTGTALQGKTVALRDGNYDVGTLAGFDGTLSDYVTWQGASGDRTAVKIYRTVSGRKAEIVLNGAGSKFLALDTLTVEYEQVAATVNNGAGSKVGLLRIQNGGDFKVNNCVLAGDLLPWQEGGVPRQEHAGIFATNVSNIEVTNSDISGFVHCCNIVSVTNFLAEGNDLHSFWGDAFQLLGDTPGPAVNYVIRNNSIYDFVGTYCYLHQDAIQTFNEGIASATSDFLGLVIEGNVVFPGTKTLLAGPLMDSPVQRPAATYNGTYITSDTTFTAADQDLQWEVMATGGDVTITLPAASNFGTREYFVVVRHPMSDSNVIVTFDGSDTMDGSASDVTLTDTGPVHCTVEGDNSSDWTRYASGNNIQGWLLQDLSEQTPLPRFYGLRVSGNILWINNANGATMGNNTRSIVQDGRAFNNTILEFFPGDTNGDGVIDDFDGLANSSPRLRWYGTDDCIDFRNVAQSFLQTGPNTAKPKSVSAIGYTNHNQASMSALFANQSSTGTIAPTTRAEAITLARPDSAGALNLGSDVYAGAVGPTDATGYWNFATGAANDSYSGAPTVTSSSFADGALAITFDMPIEFGTGDVVLRRNGGSGFADHETFSIATDVEDVLGDSVGTAGRMHLEGNTLVVVPTDVSAGGTFALRIAGTAIDSVYADSFAGIADDTTITFTVAASGIAPTFVGAYSAANNGVTQSINSVPIPAGRSIFFLAYRIDTTSATDATISVPGATVTAIGRAQRSRMRTIAFQVDRTTAATVTVGVDHGGTFSQHVNAALYNADGGTVARVEEIAVGGGGNAEFAHSVNVGAGDAVVGMGVISFSGGSKTYSITSGWDNLDANDPFTIGQSAYAASATNLTAGTPASFVMGFDGSNQDKAGVVVVLEA